VVHLISTAGYGWVQLARLAATSLISQRVYVRERERERERERVWLLLACTRECMYEGDSKLIVK